LNHRSEHGKAKRRAGAIRIFYSSAIVIGSGLFRFAMDARGPNSAEAKAGYGFAAPLAIPSK